MAMPPSMPAMGRVRFALMAGSLAAGAVPDTVMQRAMPKLEKLSIQISALQTRRDRLVGELRRLGYSLVFTARRRQAVPR